MKKLLLATKLFAALLLMAGMVIGMTPSTSALGLNDDRYWYDCTNRKEVKNGYVYDTQNRLLGKVSIFSCDQGFYTHVRSYATTKRNIYARMIREDPYVIRQSSYYGYAAQSQILAKVRGTCYKAFGSVQGNKAGMNLAYCHW